MADIGDIEFSPSPTNPHRLLRVGQAGSPASPLDHVSDATSTREVQVGQSAPHQSHLIQRDSVTHETAGLHESQFAALKRSLEAMRLVRTAITGSLDGKNATVSPSDQTALITKARTVALTNGALFWKKEIKPGDPEKKLLDDKIWEIGEITNALLAPEDRKKNSGSRHGIDNVLTTFSGFVDRYHKTKAEGKEIESDNLGDHFAKLETYDPEKPPRWRPHQFLEGISIAELRKKASQNPEGTVVLVAAASSGLVEAGIIAHYMNEELHIPTTIDPVFITKKTHKHGMRQGWVVDDPLAVIPIDDRDAFTGYSVVEAYFAAVDKYGDDQGNPLVIVNRNLELWLRNQQRDNPINVKKWVEAWNTSPKEVLPEPADVSELSKIQIARKEQVEKVQ